MPRWPDRTHCAHGHPRTPENVTKWRQCKLCIDAASKKRKLANPEESKQAVRRYQKKHAAECNQRTRAWRANNRAYCAAFAKAYHKAHPEIGRAAAHRRRCAIGKFTAAEWRQLIQYYKNTCLCCGRSDVPMTPDHVIPISKGGTGFIENIQPLCLKCGLRKNAKHIDYRLLCINPS
jgi:hypothetical protein